MNTETGDILTRQQLALKPDMFKAQCVLIDEQVMTRKQKAEMRVSKHDNRSALGRLRIDKRFKARNKPCPCGSGRKFKKCCWFKVLPADCNNNLIRRTESDYRKQRF